MPAITQLLWLVWSLRAVLSDLSSASRPEKSPSDSAMAGVVAGRLTAGACAVTAAGLCLGCWWTATLPELWCRTWLQLGDAEWERQRPEAAQAHYLEAAAADRWAIEPLERSAEIEYQRWQQSRLDADFDEAVRRRQLALDRLPFASRPHRRLGQIWQSRFERSRDPRHAQAAAAAFAAAVERYPHHAELLSEWATACDGAGLIPAAREAARRAIRQDDLNRQAGHADKFLAERTRSRMEQLAAEDQ